MSENSYIITFRSDPPPDPEIARGGSRGGDERPCPESLGKRLDNLQAVLRWVSQAGFAEIIVVEQDRERRLPVDSLPPGCIHVFAFNEGPFNKSWGFNIGFRHSSGRVIACGDADVIIDPRNMAKSFAICHVGADAVKPYDRLIDLTEEETGTFLRQGGGLPAERHDQKPNREGIGEFICFCGGLFLIRRTVYEDLGGFDERFLGWGGEDDAMSIKLARLGHGSLVMSGQAAYHLFHERPRDLRYGHAKYQQNVALVQEYRRASSEILQAFCSEQRQMMGNPDKYRKQSN